MSLTKKWLEQQAAEQNNALARARREISFASRVVNQDRPLDWEDRETIARALGPFSFDALFVAAKAMWLVSVKDRAGETVRDVAVSAIPLAKG